MEQIGQLSAEGLIRFFVHQLSRRCIYLDIGKFGT